MQLQSSGPAQRPANSASSARPATFCGSLGATVRNRGGKLIRRLFSVAGVTAIAVLVPSLSSGAVASQVATTVYRPPAQLLVRPFAKTVKSTNWSGYAVAGSAKFTDVKGTWKEPTAKCSGGASQYASFWVGIDGYSSDSVEQLGSDSDCSGGSPSYYAWYEMYPANSVNLSSSKYPVKPGDSLTAKVSVSGTSFTLSIKSSAGWKFSITKSSSTVKQSSAEWVAESPEICNSTCKIAQLADFGKIHFTNAEAAAGGSDKPISSFTTSSGPFEIIMTASNHTTVRARPGKLGTTGKSFTDTWKHS
jgi:hypothetical protein